MKILILSLKHLAIELYKHPIESYIDCKIPPFDKTKAFKTSIDCKEADALTSPESPSARRNATSP